MNDYIEKQARYNALRLLLYKHEYWTSKRTDDEYTESEWAERVAQRRAWRDEVRVLEAELPALEQAYHEEQDRLERERWEAEQARIAEEERIAAEEAARALEEEGGSIID